jgi:hypothetical protein
MLQAHSYLWHYLWVAPNLFLLALAALILRRGYRKQFPVFLAFAIIAALVQLTIYVADVLPSISAATWWKMFWAGLLIEAVLKVALIGEMFAHVSGSYASIAKLGRTLVGSAGVVLVLLAAIVAAHTPKDSTSWIVAGAHILEQTIYLIESGLILFLFIFAAYFKLNWKRAPFGIALGLGFSACVHLATWALAANGNFDNRYRIWVDFLNMAAYHVCVLIWSYYLLVPQRSATTPTVSLPEHNLEVWNRELERLLQR